MLINLFSKSIIIKQINNVSNNLIQQFEADLKVQVRPNLAPASFESSARIRKKQRGAVSAEGARFEAPRGWGVLVFDLEMVSFGAFWVAFYVL